MADNTGQFDERERDEQDMNQQGQEVTDPSTAGDTGRDDSSSELSSDESRHDG